MYGLYEENSSKCSFSGGYVMEMIAALVLLNMLMGRLKPAKMRFYTSTQVLSHIGALPKSKNCRLGAGQLADVAEWVDLLASSLQMLALMEYQPTGRLPRQEILTQYCVSLGFISTARFDLQKKFYEQEKAHFQLTWVSENSKNTH